MSELNLETVAQFLKRADDLRTHYYLQIRTPDGKIPRNMDAAIRELLIGHFEDEWKPLLMARISIEDPERLVDIVDVGPNKMFNVSDGHIGGSVRFLVNSEKEELQTGMQILCQRPDGSQVLVQAYSDPVPLFRFQGEERYLNVDASEPSRELYLLQYVNKHNLKVLGWIGWPWPR